ncbi:MAG: hypothetical protein ACI9C0_000522, partial [Alteromonadaceae bacterium]
TQVVYQYFIGIQYIPPTRRRKARMKYIIDLTPKLLAE